MSSGKDIYQVAKGYMTCILQVVKMACCKNQTQVAKLAMMHVYSMWQGNMSRGTRIHVHVYSKPGIASGKNASWQEWQG